MTDSADPEPKEVSVLRIDTHHHLITPRYRAALRSAGIDSVGGRALPEWSPEASLATMAQLEVGTAILSASMPGTAFFDNPSAAAALARDLNDDTAEIVSRAPDRFGFFATLPTPHADQAAAEARRALDELGADGVVLLANADGHYLGGAGLERLWQILDDRAAVVFIHPATLPGPTVDDIPPFATDFLLDTTRATYLLVRNGIKRRYPSIRFILSHAGGFVPYAAHRMAISLLGDQGRSVLDTLDDFRDFYYDTALSSSAATLPSLLDFAGPERILFGSDWPFAPAEAALYFAGGLDDHPLTAQQRHSIDRGNAERLFPRLAVSAPTAVPTGAVTGIRNDLKRRVFRVMSRAAAGR